MEIIKMILEIIFNIMLIASCATMTYAILSTLIETIYKDVLKRKEIGRLIKENIELKEKINQLEIEIIDKELAKEYNKK